MWHRDCGPEVPGKCESGCGDVWPEGPLCKAAVALADAEARAEAAEEKAGDMLAEAHEQMMLRNTAVESAGVLSAKVERLRGYLRDLAEGDCAYGDGCPDFGSRHGTCYPCQARKALEESK